MWTNDQKPKKMKWQEGIRYCSNLKNSTSYDNWRLPSFLELLTISDRGNLLVKDSSFLYIMTTYDKAYMPYLLLSDENNERTGGEGALVHCVRPLDERKKLIVIAPVFIKKNHKNVVIDSSTNLMWQNEPYTLAETYANKANNNHGKVQNASGAMDYCSSLNLSGYHDWFLPTIIEFSSLVNFNKKPFLAYEIFDNRNLFSGRFWTSTRQKSNYYIISMRFIDYFKITPDNVTSVRCVRIID